MNNRYVLVAIALATVVTWVPRILPFALTKNRTLPPLLIRFLNFLPITIIFALTLSSVMDEQVGRLPQILPVEGLAVVPTFLVIAKTKNILLAVLVGIVSVALLRLIF